jgi:hypothetical protein
VPMHSSSSSSTFYRSSAAYYACTMALCNCFGMQDMFRCARLPSVFASSHCVTSEASCHQLQPTLC